MKQGGMSYDYELLACKKVRVAVCLALGIQPPPSLVLLKLPNGRVEGRFVESRLS